MVLRILKIGLLLLIGLTGYNQSDTTDLIEEVLPYNLQNPIGFEFDLLGRCFIWEKAGKIHVIDSSGQQQPQLLLDLSEEVVTFGDHGLVGFALHPNFHINGLFYVYYTVDRYFILNSTNPDYDPQESIENQATIGRVTRYRATLDGPVIADRSTRKILIGHNLDDGLPILMTSHGVGSLVFGQDGTLLLSFGDGGSFTENDLGSANDTYHEQALRDGMIRDADNVGSMRSVMRNNPHGKILRVDPNTGEGLPSNPYFDTNQPHSHRSRIWSLGFRNPYKFIRIPDSGDHNPTAGMPGKFLVGDVGSAYWEELSLIETGGEWFGWPFFEGYGGRNEYWSSALLNQDAVSNDCSAGAYQFRQLVKDEAQDHNYLFEDPCRAGRLLAPSTPQHVHKRPIFAYSNDRWNPPAKTRIGSFTSEGKPIGMSIQDANSGVEGQIIEGGSIIPGEINRYDHFPDHVGHLFIGDFHGAIFNAALDENYGLTSVSMFLDVAKGITDLKFNPRDGKLYYINVLENEMRRIQNGGALAPKIKATADKTFGPSPLEVQFDASQSIDYSDAGLTYFWDFGDGSTSTSTQPTHSYISTDIQVYNVTLTVTDGNGMSSEKNMTISLNNTPPLVEITSITDGQTYAMDDYTILPLESNISDAEHRIEDLQSEWRVDLYHDSHFHPGSIDTRNSTKTIIDPLGCGIESYWYQVYLTVHDPAGLSATDTVRIYPYCGAPIAQVQLSASLDDAGIKIHWEILGDSNASQYAIEKTDDYLFTTIQSDIAAGIDTDFEYMDTSPFIGQNKYRIRAIDDQGNYSYSNIVTIDFFSDEILHTVKPNPSNGNFVLDISNIQSEVVYFELFDFAGKIVVSQTWPSENGRIEQNIFLDDLASGIYTYRLTIGERRILSKILMY